MEGILKNDEWTVTHLTDKKRTYRQVNYTKIKILKEI